VAPKTSARGARSSATLSTGAAATFTVMVRAAFVGSVTVNVPADGKVKAKLSVGVRTGDSSLAAADSSLWSTVSRLTHETASAARISTVAGTKAVLVIWTSVAASAGAATASATRTPERT